MRCSADEECNALLGVLARLRDAAKLANVGIGGGAAQEEEPVGVDVNCGCSGTACFVSCGAFPIGTLRLSLLWQSSACAASAVGPSPSS